MTASRLVILRRSPSIVTNTGSLSAATSSAGRFFLGRPRGLPDWPFLKRGVQRRLAIVGRVFALRFGHVYSSAPWAPMLPMPIAARRRQPSLRYSDRILRVFGSANRDGRLPAPRAAGCRSRLAEAEFRRYIRAVLHCQYDNTFICNRQFETDESTPGSLPCYPPDSPIQAP